MLIIIIITIIIIIIISYHHPHLEPHGVHIEQELVELCLCPELLQPQHRVGAQPGLLYISI